VNISAFALPMATFYRPPVAGGFEGANFAVWLITHLFFEFKFITIFSMLFGAGLMVISARARDRAQASVGVRAPSGAGLYYRRLAILLCLGLAHAYFLWYGDILTFYAILGVALWPLRRVRPAALVGIAVALLLVYVPVTALSAYFLRGPVEAAAQALASGVERDPATAAQLAMYDPTPEQIARETALMRGPYGPMFEERAGFTIFFQIVGLFFFGPWRILPVMLLGMALARWGVFHAARPTRFYATLAIAGYGVGLPSVAYGAWRLVDINFALPDAVGPLTLFNQLGSIAVALGHVGLVMLLFKRGVFTTGALAPLGRGLRAMGRMALTNYLMQTFICVTLFYGAWGLGWFNALSRVEMALVVISIWIFQLVISPLWLKVFRTGPMEWLWRTLTYWRLQPVLAPRPDAATTRPTA
jgi:uncharacterized protein